MRDIQKIKEFFTNEAITRAYEEQQDDAVDTITMDVPLFIRMLEYAREDANEDVDLHDVTEKAITLGKEKGILQMEDYDAIVSAAENTSKNNMTENKLRAYIREMLNKNK